MARVRGSAGLIVDSCGPLSTISTLVEHNAFGFEGRVIQVESRLTSDQRDLYTEYTFDLIRVLHQRAVAPLLFEPPRSSPGPTRGPRVVVWGPVGRVEIEGLIIRKSVNDHPVFKVGQHLVVFAFYSEHYKYWQVAIDGVMEVRPGHLVPLSKSLKIDGYDSVNALSAAINRLASTKRTETGR